MFQLDNEKNIILSIDVGILNLGLSLLTADADFKFLRVVGVDLYDLTVFRCDRNTCSLHHERTFTDWIDHFLSYFQSVFSQVTHVVIELQPPSGLKGIEQLLFSHFRKKATLVHPQSMHKYFQIGSLDYDGRKKMVQKKCLKILESQIKLARSPAAKDLAKNTLQDYLKFDRRHDIADAVSLALFFLKKKRDNLAVEKRNDARKKMMERKILYKDSLITIENLFASFSFKRY